MILYNYDMSFYNCSQFPHVLNLQTVVIKLTLFSNIHLKHIQYEASRGAGAQNVTVTLTGCGFDTHSKK